MRKKGNKYILRESELRHVINLCALSENVATGQPQQTGTTTAATTAAPAQTGMTPQEQQQLAQLAALPQDQKAQVAKQEVGLLKNGQADPNDPLIRSFLYMIFGGTVFWDVLAQQFGWDKEEQAAGNGGQYNTAGLDSGAAYDGAGGGKLPVVSMSYAEWMQGDGKNHVSSPLTQMVIISPNRVRRRKKITKVTIHHFASVGSAEEVGAQFQQPSRRASANYGIGNDGKIVLYVPEDYAAGTSNSSWNDQQAVTIEVSNSRSDKKQKTDFNNPNQWPIGQAALRSLIALCKDICSRNGITPVYTGDPNGTFTEHRMFASTACPGPFIHNGLVSRNGQEGWLIRAIKGSA